MNDTTATPAMPSGEPTAAEAMTGVKPSEHQQEASEEQEPRGLGLAEYGVVALIALAMSVAVLTAGWAFLPKPQRFGVIDLPGIVEIEQLSLTASMMRSSVTDGDRAQAFERVKDFGPKLEAAIEAARHECGCILLSRNAYVGQVDLDMTASVKKRLGLDAIDVAALKERIQKSVEGSFELPKK